MGRRAFRTCVRIVMVAAVASLALAGTPARSQAAAVMKFGTTVAPGNPTTDAAAEFARVAAERSKGQLKVEVYPNNQLGRGENALLEGVQLGSVDITVSGSAAIGGIFEPSYQALDLPFLWASREQIWKTMDGPIGQELLKKMERRASRASASVAGGGSAT